MFKGNISVINKNMYIYKIQIDKRIEFSYVYVKKKLKLLYLVENIVLKNFLHVSEQVVFILFTKPKVTHRDEISGRKQRFLDFPRQRFGYVIGSNIYVFFKISRSCHD